MNYHATNLMILLDGDTAAIDAAQRALELAGLVRSDHCRILAAGSSGWPDDWMVVDIRGRDGTPSCLVSLLPNNLERVILMSVCRANVGVATSAASVVPSTLRMFSRKNELRTARNFRGGAGDRTEAPFLGRAAESEYHSIARWASLVVRTIELQRDPTTLLEWGKSLGISRGALRNWCLMANLPAGRSLRFARLLRAVVRLCKASLAPQDVLNVVDRRSLRRMMCLAGGTENQLPTTIEDFLARQVLITNPIAIELVNKIVRDKAAKAMIGRPEEEVSA